MSLLNYFGIETSPDFISQHWVDMPEFIQEEKEAFSQVEVCFDSEKDLQDFAKLINQKLTNKTKSSWFPFKSHFGKNKKVWVSDTPQLPQFPIYIVSKNRWETRLTSKALDLLGVQYKIIVEESQYQNYVNEVGSDKVLILPQKYFNEYDTCDEFGLSKSTGPGPARNFAWQHSIDNGYTHHWVMDDNLKSFQRLHQNYKGKVTDATIFKCAEDFILRYENVAVSGFNYETFCYSNAWCPPFVANTRIYSCLLIKNNIPYRWRGRYNEDTDLSLRVLKDKLITIQFNAFLCEKITTQRMRGGNSEEFYDNEGTLNKSDMLEKLHPDVATVKWKFNRWHHYVNYKPFANNKLKFISEINTNKAVNEYGMKLKTLGNE